jgi:hypothetical protein
MPAALFFCINIGRFGTFRDISPIRQDFAPQGMVSEADELVPVLFERSVCFALA